MGKTLTIIVIAVVFTIIGAKFSGQVNAVLPF